MDIEVNYAFPVSSDLTKEEMQQHFWKCLYTSSEQEMLHYWVVLPKNIKPAELEPMAFPGTGLTNIGRYFTTDESPYLEVWVAYERCQWEMNASDWLFKKLALTGEKVLHRRLVGNAAENGIFADVLTVKTHSSGDEVISRFTVQKDYNRDKGGGNYFLLKASCASRDYAALANDIYFTVVSWDLLHRSNLPLAELLTSVDLGGESAFKIPLSWHAKTIAENRIVVDHTIEGINYGVINFYFYSASECYSVENAFNKSTARFHQHDDSVTLVANELEDYPNDINDRLGKITTCTGEVYSEKDKMRAFYQSYIFNYSGVWCYVELVGQHRTNKSYNFEANKRCVEIILATLSFNFK
ncbi:hypothetical protein ACMGGR_18205 [Erwinia sp. BNK-24-b]|uniref:hypothetical protein n=1 Tax=unclassified Erwinia TaxID=2622719 RepID=UPI0039BFEFDE